jgi:hypothetical protein
MLHGSADDELDEEESAWLELILTENENDDDEPLVAAANVAPKVAAAEAAPVAAPVVVAAAEPAAAPVAAAAAAPVAAPVAAAAEAEPVAAAAEAAAVASPVGETPPPKRSSALRSPLSAPTASPLSPPQAPLLEKNTEAAWQGKSSESEWHSQTWAGDSSAEEHEHVQRRQAWRERDGAQWHRKSHDGDHAWDTCGEEQRSGARAWYDNDKPKENTWYQNAWGNGDWATAQVMHTKVYWRPGDAHAHDEWPVDGYNEHDDQWLGDDSHNQWLGDDSQNQWLSDDSHNAEWQLALEASAASATPGSISSVAPVNSTNYKNEYNCFCRRFSAKKTQALDYHKFVLASVTFAQ